MSTRKRQANRGLRKRCGCPRSKWPKCEHPWHFHFKWKGVHHRISLDKHLERRVEGKTEAEDEAAKLRIAIKEGRFGAAVQTRSTLTVAQLLDTYLKEYVTMERSRSLENVRYQVGVIVSTPIELPTGERRTLSECLVCDVSTGVIEKFRAARRTRTLVVTTDREGRECARRKGGVGTANRDLALLRAMFNWAIRLGYIDASPFKRFTETVVKLTKESSRRRRLEGDECERLLKACDPLLLNPKTRVPFFDQPRPRLRPIVEAALETGCRRGELLSLQWWQVKDLDGPNPRLDLPASKTKTNRDRVVPISSRLKAILEMRRKDPAGEPLPPQAYVFGNEIGQRSESIKSAWRLVCRRAGIENLRFHDLRREAGSRWLEGGVPLQTVRDWLGHTNISQTSTYLESTLTGQHEAMRRFEQVRAAQVPQQASLGQEVARSNSPTDGTLLAPCATDALCHACATEDATQGGQPPQPAGAFRGIPQQTVN
jgi:integrase